jgi:hypothetical protein
VFFYFIPGTPIREHPLGHKLPNLSPAKLADLSLPLASTLLISRREQQGKGRCIALSLQRPFLHGSTIYFKEITPCNAIIT